MRLEAGVFSHKEAFKLRHDLQEKKHIPLKLVHSHFQYMYQFYGFIDDFILIVFNFSNFSPFPFLSLTPWIQLLHSNHMDQYMDIRLT